VGEVEKCMNKNDLEDGHFHGFICEHTT